jgi:hypothetical protein
MPCQVFIYYCDVIAAGRATARALGQPRTFNCDIEVASLPVPAVEPLILTGWVRVQHHLIHNQLSVWL